MLIKSKDGMTLIDADYLIYAYVVMLNHERYDLIAIINMKLENNDNRLILGKYNNMAEAKDALSYITKGIEEDLKNNWDLYDDYTLVIDLEVHSKNYKEGDK